MNSSSDVCNVVEIASLNLPKHTKMKFMYLLPLKLVEFNDNP